jgi:hypothetical protein
MPKNKNYSFTRCNASMPRPGHAVIVVLALMVAFMNSSCLFRGQKSAVMPSAPVRIAFLPFNTPEDDKDLQWASMAMPIMMAKITQRSQRLELAPLWETMQFTLESVGNSRLVTEDSAAYVANWLSAKWSSMGELSQDNKNKVSLMIDFIPSRETNIPFRYVKTVKMDTIDRNVRKSFEQFLNYISSRPMERSKISQTSLASLRQLAEALDREYGWSVPAEPGEAQEIVANLAQSDIRLARHLFNPAVYPILKEE